MPALRKPAWERQNAANKFAPSTLFVYPYWSIRVSRRIRSGLVIGNRSIFSGSACIRPIPLMILWYRSSLNAESSIPGSVYTEWSPVT